MERPVAWRDVRTLFGREVRSALRERSVVVNSILLPVLLYPLLLWIEISALVFVTGLSERAPARLALVGATEAQAELFDAGDPGAADGRFEIAAREEDPDDALIRLADGELDAVLVFEARPEPEGTLGDNFEVAVHYDRSTDRSRRALQRVEARLDRYRERRLGEEAIARGVGQAALEPFAIERRNVSSDEALGATVLGVMVPLFLVISVALGCLVPAVDTTAGERERGTWETVMSTRASRGSIVTAKYLYVAAFGTVAGLLNVGAMSLSLGPVMAPLRNMSSGGPDFAVALTPGAVLVMGVGAVLLALFFAAAMMLLASFARSFKDGQALVTPIFYLALLPLILGQQTDRTLSPAIASVPVANIAMAVRDAIHGVFVWPLLGLTALVSLALVFVCLGAARYVLRFEDYLLGTHGGSLGRFIRDRARGSRHDPPPRLNAAEEVR